MEKRSDAYLSDQIPELPFCRSAVVLGCSPNLSNGQENPFFKHRISRAAQLYHSKRISTLIVSGDNSTKTYNEPQEMKNALIQEGVPSQDIVCDYAGFSTLDSVLRAKAVFGQTQFIVVSQEFHNKRSIYIARSNKIEAYGLNAENVATAISLKTLLREELARVKSVIDIWILNRQPKFLGPQIFI